jgi:2-polyprenyl-3-methyl-5-hydroxy-6-metoxy-1,4-benzoquinol methylase
MNYKEALYGSYVSTHIAHRKSVESTASLRARAAGFRQHFGSLLPRDLSAKIADLGCGSGSLVWWMQRMGYTNVHGVDGSHEQVEVARANGIASVALGDVFDYLGKERGHDALFARDLIEHFDRQAVFDFLRACHSSLRPGGRLILQVPNAEYPFFGRVLYGDFTHEAAFTTSSAKQVLGAAGFARVRVGPWRPTIQSAKSFVRYVLWRGLEFVYKTLIALELGSWKRVVTMNLIVVAEKDV